MSNIFRVKCIVAGEPTVGKTSIVQILQSQLNNFSKAYNMTLGIELSTKVFSVPNSDNVVEFYIYDSSGKDVYNDVLIKYWCNPDVLILVYDCTSKVTFESCEKWLNLVKSTNTDKNILKGILLANKIDESRRLISTEQGKNLADKLGLMYCECSCKQKLGIIEAIQMLISDYSSL